MVNCLGVDYGAKRVGIALASDVRVARPLVTLENNAQLVEQVAGLAAEHEAQLVVVGLPRNLDGQETAQTKLARQFAQRLQQAGLRIYLQDEAATSLPGAADKDQAAAVMILQDYLDEHSADN